MNIELIVPTGPRSCRVLYIHLFLDPDGPDGPDGREIERVICIADEVMEQDRAMVEVVQRNLESGVYDDGLLSPKHERGLVQFQDLVRATWA